MERRVIASGENVTLDSELFTFLDVSGYGGAVFNQGTVSVLDSVFQNDSAISGGAVYTETIAGISGSTFSNNLGRMNGGAINNIGTVSLAHSEFFANTASQNGGGLYTTGDVVVSDVVFKYNVASVVGGAIYHTGDSTFADMLLSGNTAGQNGGGFYNFGTASITGSTFSGNRAANGGAIYNIGSLTLTDVTFSGNTASKNGGAIYNAANASLYLDGCVFTAASDVLYAKNSNVFIIGDITTERAFTLEGSSRLVFSNEHIVNVDGTFVFGSTASLCFANTQYAEFAVAQDFSTTKLTTTTDWSKAKSFTLASGDLTFADEQPITINNETAQLGSSRKIYDGYYVKAQVIDCNGQDRLVLSSFDKNVDIADKVNGLVNLADEIESGVAEGIGFDHITNDKTISKSSLGTNNLVAGAAKSISGNGLKTKIKANLFGNGYDLVLSNLNWEGFVFGGGKNGHENGAKQTVTLTGVICVTNAFGGSRIAEESFSEESTSTLTLNEDAAGTFTILAGGNLVSAAATEITDTFVTVLSDDVDVAEGFLIGGSVVNQAVDYTVVGNAVTEIEGGVYDWVVGSGFLQKADSAYTQEGDVELTIRGGTIHRIFGGIASSDAKIGTKTVNGNINITIDSSEKSVSLCTVYAGDNGSNSTVDGSVSVVFTGLGENLAFVDQNNGVVGDSATAQRTVTGTRTFTFDKFSGLFDAYAVKKFDTISFVNSDVNFHIYDLSGVSTWKFDSDSTLVWNDGCNNDFAGDALLITGTPSLAGGFSFITTDDQTLLSGWEEFDTVTLFGESAKFDSAANAWSSDHYLMNCISSEGEYKLTVNSKIA